MVYISKQAKIDLDNIVIGLLEWNKVELPVDEVMCYVDDMVDICYQLGNSIYHRKATCDNHLRFGSYTYPYKRNKNTIWYIIYEIDSQNNILVNKIINNHVTIV
jgi:hypothetical protein